jgi:hypothetical protein
VFNLLIGAGIIGTHSNGLRNGRPGFDSKQGQKDVPLLHSVQTNDRSHPASYPTGTGGSFLGGKAAAE